MTSSVKFSTKYLQRLRTMKRALYACHVNIVLQSTTTCVHIFTYLLPHAVKCRRFCFWRLQYVLFRFCIKHLRNHWTDLRQIHTEDVFGPSLGQVWRSRSNVKGQGHQEQKWHFLALSAACVCVLFMFGKTFLASKIWYLVYWLPLQLFYSHYTGQPAVPTGQLTDQPNVMWSVQSVNQHEFHSKHWSSVDAAGLLTWTKSDPSS